MSQPLHIVIDARWIFKEISGIGLYTQELIAGLARLSTPHRFTLLFNRADVMARTASYTHFTMNQAFCGMLVRQGPFSPHDQALLPFMLRSLKANVFHAPNYMMPVWMPKEVQRVVTIHDLIPLLFRDHAPRSRKNRFFPVFKRLMQTVARNADRVIAVSEATKADILRHLPGTAEPSDKITVIHEAARPVCVPGTRPNREDVEFLFVGRRDPYKNLPMLISAFAEIRRQGLPVRLRVVGSPDARYPEANAVAHAEGVDAQIIWSGYVPDPQLVTALQQADVYVHPSSYEGFGLPVLEAMACGTPVICSRCSSLPEVAGDAALYIDPAQPESLVEAMIRTARDPALRADLARRGLDRAATFSWEKTARQTLEVYESAAY